MSFRNFDSKRELFARQDYTRAVVQKRDLLARRIKGDDKKVNLDINKVIAEINKGNLAVLEELDKAGIAYTLTDNSQAFDGKSGSQTVTFKIGETTYTATYEGKTKEQEEAEKKQKEIGTVRLESFLDRYYENVNTKNTSSNTTSAVPQAQPVLNDRHVITPESEESVQPKVSEVTPTTTSQTLGTDETKPTTSSSTTETTSVSAVKNTGITVESIMEKYGYNHDFAQLILNYISDRASKSAVGTNEIAKKATEMFNNLDEILNPDLDGYETLNTYRDNNSYGINYHECALYGSIVDKWDFFKYMVQEVVGTEIFDACEYISDKTIDSGAFEYFLNSNLSKYYDGDYIKDTGYLPHKIIDEFYLRLRDELRGETRNYDECKANSMPSYYFSLNGLTTLDKNGNGFIDEFYQQLTEYFTPLRDDAKYILEHCEDNNGSRFSLYLKNLLENQYNLESELKFGKYDYLISKLNETGISCIEIEDGDNNGWTKTLKFNFNGIDYEISNKFNFKNNSYEYTISTKQSENNPNKSLEAQLEWNIQMLSEYPGCSLDASLNIMAILDKLGIYHSGKSFYNESSGRYDGIPDSLAFSFNGTDYEICGAGEEKYIENTRTIDDVTEDDINEQLSEFGWGNDYTFWDGKWNDCPWFPEYDENWESNIDYIIEDYHNRKPGTFNHGVESSISAICTNYLIDILRDKCGIEDYKASKEANLAALIEYLKSIDAYTHDDKLDRTTIEWNKVYRVLYDNNPKFKEMIDLLAIGSKWIFEGNEYHSIVRTRPSKDNITQEYPAELKDDIELASSYPKQFLLNFRAKLEKEVDQAYKKIENQTEDKTERIYFNKNFQKLARDIYKENMIYVCNILSYIPEYKRLVEEMFGTNYIEAITEFCKTADFENITCISSNHPEHMNPIYLLFEKIDEYKQKLHDPNNKNGYTDVYYK